MKQAVSLLIWQCALIAWTVHNTTDSRAGCQAVNLLLFVISNSWLLAKACSWFSPVMAALSTVEWTLWNTVRPCA